MTDYSRLLAMSKNRNQRLQTIGRLMGRDKGIDLDLRLSILSAKEDNRKADYSVRGRFL